MSAPILATKLYVPPPRPKTVARPRLNERLEAGLHGKLTLVSAPAGFGKTTLVSAWLAQSVMPTAWLSLDEGESDPARFLTYFVAALQTIAPRVGAGLLAVLQSPQPPSPEMALTSLLNDIATVPERFILVLDDYHVIESQAVDQALAFLIEHLPPQMHLVITTREDPPLPLARLRVRGQLQEVRVADLRFTPEEAAGFLNEVMGLNLRAAEIAALETRTEGWVAGLQLAALSMQGQQTTSATSRATFIESFSGGHHFVLDYLLEEVLHQQSAAVQTFLLHTSILARLCGPLCDAVLGDPADSSTSGQATLEYLERANLFLVPLDNERRWYRYHHLFAELLRQRAAIVHAAQHATQHDNRAPTVEELHTRASQWFEEHGLDLEAFHHAVAANDVPRAARLVEGKGIPLHFCGAVAPVTQWIKSLPTAVLDATPMLWTALASASLAMGQPRGVPEALQAAEDALQKVEQTEETRDLIGRVAAIRATLAASQRQVETILTQSQRALEYLRPDNAAFRVFTIWKLGYAYHLRGERPAARNAYRDAIEAAAATGNHVVTTILATIGLAALQAADNELHVAAENFRHALHRVADLPLPVASEAHFGLASIHYQWGELAAAVASAERGLQTSNNDRISSCQLVLARVKLAEGDVDAAALLVEQAAALVREKKLAHRTAEVVAAQVALLLRQGNVTAAAKIAQTHDLPLSEARVLLARGDAAAASALLAPLRVEMAARAWADELLQVMVLQASAHHAQGDLDAAVAVLTEALTLAAPGGYVRLFVDEGTPMQQLLAEIAARGIMVAYVEKLLAAFAADATLRAVPAQRHEEIIHAVHTMHSVATNPVESAPTAQATTSQPLVEPPLVEPLSQRELEVLQLTAQGLSNREIGERLFLALSTVKGHNRNIFGKLQVQRRTEAVARARALGLL